MGLGTNINKVMRSVASRAIAPKMPAMPSDDYYSAADPMVLGALQGVLNSIPQAPPRGEFFAPYDQAEGRARTAYDQALPVIAQAYMDLRNKIAETTKQTAESSRQGLEQRSMAAAQGQQQVNAHQQQVLADLARQGGGQPALGSMTAGAQAEAGQNLAALALQATQMQDRARDLASTIQAQHGDRTSAANSMETAARNSALQNLNTILGQIGVQRSKAEGQYLNLESELGQQRAGAQLKIAEYLAAAQGGGDDELSDTLKRINIEKGLRELNPPARQTGIGFLQAKAKQFPTSVEWLLDAFTGNGGDVAKVIAAINAATDKDGFIRYKGKGDKGKKRLSANVLKQWAVEADSLDQQ